MLKLCNITLKGTNKKLVLQKNILVFVPYVELDILF